MDPTKGLANFTARCIAPQPVALDTSAGHAHVHSSHCETAIVPRVVRLLLSGICQIGCRYPDIHALPIAAMVLPMRDAGNFTGH